MPVAVKRQRPAVKAKAVPPKQPAPSTISTFARVSKSMTNNDVKKEVVLTTTTTPRKSTRAATAATPASRKRKAVLSLDSDSSDDEEDIVQPTPSISTPREFLTPKRGRGRPPKKTRPTTGSLKRTRSPSLSDSDQSTIATDKLFKRLRLESSPSRASSPLTTDTSLSDIELSSSVSKLPCEVLRLVDLHSSFLKTLTLHYAHNGSHVPADLRVLCPNVSRAWGRRAVTEQDIRVCIGVLTTNTTLAEKPEFSLVDYGRGKICIELDQTVVSGPLNEQRLNESFRSNIEALWAQRGAASTDAAAFVRGLHKAEVTICESVAKAAPVLAKGQKRLEEIKQGMAAKKLEKEAKKPMTAAAMTTTTTTTAAKPSPLAAAPSAAPVNPDGSKMSLLDRIRHKQLQKAAMPAGLSPAEQERRAALQRVDEVAALVGMLSRSSGGGRVSFPMATMLQKLKDSFRMGISRDEGATCVRLLAREVAPEWVMVVTLAGRENVVIETDRQLSKAEVARRVQAITARF
jgi:hypothetical protein